MLLHPLVWARIGDCQDLYVTAMAADSRLAITPKIAFRQNLHHGSPFSINAVKKASSSQHRYRFVFKHCLACSVNAMKHLRPRLSPRKSNFGNRRCRCSFMEPSEIWGDRSLGIATPATLTGLKSNADVGGFQSVTSKLLVAGYLAPTCGSVAKVARPFGCGGQCGAKGEEQRDFHIVDESRAVDLSIFPIQYVELDPDPIAPSRPTGTRLDLQRMSAQCEKLVLDER